MGTTEKLVKFVLDTSYSDLPAEAVTIAKNFVLDCLGAMLAASRERVTQMLVRYIKDSGGVAEVGVIGGGFRTSLENAAFVNGTSTHAVELEAVGRIPGGNPQHIIAAALCVAEKFKLSGKQVLEGVILGEEFQARLSLGALSPTFRGHCPLTIYGPPAVAALASKMMGLGLIQTKMAVGTAFSHSGGFFRQSGTMLHFVEAGIACRNGIASALLAREGVTADPDLIEGEWGFCDVFCPEGYDLEAITKDLGNPYHIVYPGLYIKGHGCCNLNHRTLEALLQLMRDQNVTFEQVDSVHLEVSPFHLKLLPYADPENGEQAKFSLQHAHAVAIVDGKTSLRAFSDAGAVDPKYKKAREKIQVTVRDDFPAGEAQVELKLKDGRSYSAYGGLGVVLRGGIDMPLTGDELVARYEELVRGVLSSQQVQRSIDLVFNLEQLPDVLELMELATFGYKHTKCQ
jgi:2-methylcitrate dehydratase PrpD